MKQIQNRVLIACLILVAFLTIQGVQVSSVAPTYKTGAPFDDGTCADCHGHLNNGSGSITISVDGGLTQYQPGQTYPVSITVAHAGQIAFGFSTVVANTSGNQAGTLEAITGTSIQVTSNRQYLGHTSSGITGTDSKTWTFNWTAPATGFGNVTFYAVGNATNRDFTIDGDYIYTTSITLSEAGTQDIHITDITDGPYCTGADIAVSYSNSENISSMNLELSLGNGATDTAVAVLWQFAPGDTGTVQASLPTNLPHGNYYVRLSATGFDPAYSNNTISVLVSPTQPEIVQNGDSLSANASGEGTMTWYLDGNVYEGLLDGSQPNGAYTCRYTSPDGCSAVSDTFFYQTTGIVNKATLAFSAFPNPTNDAIHIVAKANGNVMICINNLTGETLLSKKMNVKGDINEIIDLNKLPTGYYILSLYTNKGIVREKIAIQR